MSLIRRLTELQHEHGHLSDDVLHALSRSANVPLHRLHELVSFFPHFRRTPPPPAEVAVCRDISCWLYGAEEESRKLRDTLAGLPNVAVHEVSCLGHCGSKMAMCALNGKILPVGFCTALAALNSLKSSEESPDAPKLWDHAPFRCDPYPSAARRYGLIHELMREDRAGAAERVLSALRDAGLRGMGGAGFPTATKWEIVRREPRTPKYVICNADESEPGTFKDRNILAGAPHLVIEGMLLAALVTGAERGTLFLRHEYKDEGKKFSLALEEARRAEVLGTDFDIDIFVSPGGYILGEETALLECLEDRRGEPRNKPPFPGTHGLFGQPTVINNVETLAFVPGIVKNGPEWWKAQGKSGFAGLKFIALSGHVERPGVYEVPVGTTVRELIALGGGVTGGRALKAFLPGGASSNFLPASMADVPLDFQTLAKAGSMLGSGAVIVLAEGTDMLAAAANVVRFFRDESCGKCVPCRLGSQKAVELLEAVRDGKTPRTGLDVLPDLGETMAQTSICGLGQVALNPILSARKHWPEEV